MISKNAAGILVLAVSLIGLNLSPDQAVEIVSAIGTIISFGLMVWNQVSRPDVSYFFWKK